MPLVSVQLFDCPFITRIGEEVEVVKRTLRLFFHVMIQKRRNGVIKGLQERLDGKDQIESLQVVC